MHGRLATSMVTGRSVAGFLVLGLALPHLLVASLINIQSLKREALNVCATAVDCTDLPLAPWCGPGDSIQVTGQVGLLARLKNRVTMWRRASDLARLRDWEDELTRPASQRNLHYDLATLRSVVIWRLPCNAAVLERAKDEAASGLRARAHLAELSQRRGDVGAQTRVNAAPQADIVSRERAAAAAAMSVSSDDLRLGEDLLLDSGRCVRGVHVAPDSLWTSYKYDEDARFRPAMFAVGWDCHNSYSGRGALRATGLWLDRGGDRWPARATFATTSAIDAPEGPYLFTTVYRTAGSQDRSVSVALDPFLGSWELPASEDAWTHAALVTWNPRSGKIVPLLSNSGDGTVWFGEVRVRPIDVRHSVNDVDRSTKYFSLR